MFGNSRKQDPYLSLRFKITIDNLIQGGFSECSGLQSEIEVEDHRENGVNEYTHKLPKGTKYGNITLKRGFVDSDEPWKWYQNVMAGKPNQRKNLSIIIMDSLGNPKHQWDIREALPIKWSTSEFKAEGGTILIETLEFVHKGFRKTL